MTSRWRHSGETVSMPKSEADGICHTFDSYFCEYNNRTTGDLDVRTKLVQEFSMTPNRWITKLYERWQQYGYTLYMFGDPNQCSLVEFEGGTTIYYYNLDSVSVREICPNVEQVKYVSYRACMTRKLTKSWPHCSAPVSCASTSSQ